MNTTIIINVPAFRAFSCRGMTEPEAWGCHDTYDAFLVELRNAAIRAGFRFETDAGRDGPVPYRIVEGQHCALRASDALEFMEVQVANMRGSKIA